TCLRIVHDRLKGTDILQDILQVVRPLSGCVYLAQVGVEDSDGLHFEDALNDRRQLVPRLVAYAKSCRFVDQGAESFRLKRKLRGWRRGLLWVPAGRKHATETNHL